MSESSESGHRKIFTGTQRKRDFADYGGSSGRGAVATASSGERKKPRKTASRTSSSSSWVHEASVSPQPKAKKSSTGWRKRKAMREAIVAAQNASMAHQVENEWAANAASANVTRGTINTPMVLDQGNRDVEDDDDDDVGGVDDDIYDDDQEQEDDDHDAEDEDEAQETKGGAKEGESRGGNRADGTSITVGKVSKAVRGYPAYASPNFSPPRTAGESSQDAVKKEPFTGVTVGSVVAVLGPVAPSSTTDTGDEGGEAAKPQSPPPVGETVDVDGLVFCASDR